MNDIDFLELVLSNCADPINENNLKSYFIREFKKAERDNYFDAQSFFQGCLVAINMFEEKLKKEYCDRVFNIKSFTRMRKQENNPENILEIQNETNNLNLNICILSSSFNPDKYENYSPAFENFRWALEFASIKKGIYSAFYELSPFECIKVAYIELEEHLPNEVLGKIDKLDSQRKFMQSDNETELSAFYKYKESITVKRSATTEDVANYKSVSYNSIKVGDEIQYIPIVETKDEIFERMKKLHAQLHFELLKWEFIKCWGEGTERTIKDELEVINGEIEQAEAISTKLTGNDNINFVDIEMEKGLFYEYSRLINGYYENKTYKGRYYNNKSKAEIMPQQVNEFFTPDYTAKTYAKYFLYKEWLENKRDKLQVSDSKYDYNLLSVELREWFNTTPINVKLIIEESRTVENKKIPWQGKPTDAFYFIDFFWPGATLKPFDNCFYLKNGKTYPSLKPKKFSEKNKLWIKLKNLSK